jgi:hypothetical protein
VGYDVRKDANQDGSVSAADSTWAASVAGGYQTLGRGVLSSTSVNNRQGYAGYTLLDELAGSVMLARNRVYDGGVALRSCHRDRLCDLGAFCPGNPGNS